MARKRTNQKQSEVEVDLQFPVEGLDQTRAYVRQRPGTTASCQNVRTFEPTTGRARGGSRRGLARYFPNQVAGTYPIQDINHIATGGVSAPTTTTTGGQGTFALASASGFGIMNISGAVVQTGLVAAANTRFENSCWDSLGNLYVVMRNTTTGAANLYSYTGAGVLRWGPTALPTTITGTNRGVPGICAINTSGTLTFTGGTGSTSNTGTNGTIILVGTVQSGSPTFQIHVVNASLGTISTAYYDNANVISTAGALTQMVPSTAAVNCFGAIGTIMACEVKTASSTGGIYIFDWSKPRINAFITANFYAGATASNTRALVVPDGVATFYVLSSTTTGQIRSFGTGAIQNWASTALDSTVTSLAIDTSVHVLLAANSASNSVQQIVLTTGAIGSAVTPGNPGTVTHWDNIASDNNGHWTVWRNSNASNDIMGFTIPAGTITTNWPLTSFANTIHDGVSIFPSTSITTPGMQSARQIIGLVVSNGKVFTFNSTGATAVINSQALSAAATVVFSAQNGVKMYYVDGTSPYTYYDPSLGKMVAWTAANGGVMPMDANNTPARLICDWRARIVLAGLVADPQNWFMSAVGDPTNFNYNPTSTTTTQAVSGDTGDVGKTGEPVTCLIPYNDDTLIFGMSHSIWQLTGDPAAGGSFDVISHHLGMAWGQPYAIDPYEQIYFFGSKMGIWKLTPGALPVRISQQIERLIENIDLSQNLIRMQWDFCNQGLAVWITPLNPLLSTTNFFWEERVNAWWPDVYANSNHNPLSVHLYDGDSPNDRSIMIGGRDGYVHIMSNAATLDDTTAITSFVFLGPIQTAQGDVMLLKEIQAILGASSGTVTFDIFVGPSTEAALSSASVLTGTLNAASNVVSYTRRSGRCVWVRLQSTNQWALERIIARYQPSGMVARRSNY